MHAGNYFSTAARKMFVYQGCNVLQKKMDYSKIMNIAGEGLWEKGYNTRRCTTGKRRVIEKKKNNAVEGLQQKKGYGK